MKHVLQKAQVRTDVVDCVEAATGQKVRNCYQCGKCSAGCPIAMDMDVLPNQVMRLLQLGITDQALRCRTIWLCASCETCTTRCPREVDLAAVMDALRHLALRREVPVPERRIAFFNRTFLSIIRRYGRVFEMELIGRFNTGTFQFFKDVSKAPGLLMKGRLKLLPSFNGRKTASAVFRGLDDVDAALPAPEPVAVESREH